MKSLHKIKKKEKKFQHIVSPKIFNYQFCVNKCKYVSVIFLLQLFIGPQNSHHAFWFSCPSLFCVCVWLHSFRSIFLLFLLFVWHISTAYHRFRRTKYTNMYTMEYRKFDKKNERWERVKLKSKNNNKKMENVKRSCRWYKSFLLFAKINVPAKISMINKCKYFEN